MFKEKRLIGYSFPRDTVYKIDGAVIGRAGKKLREEQQREQDGVRMQVERAFVVIAQVEQTADDTRVSINNLLTLPRNLGTRDRVEVGRMYDEIYDPNCNYGEGNSVAGIAHSHIPQAGRNRIYGDADRGHSPYPSGGSGEPGDLEAIRDAPQASVGIVMTVNPNGGGTICVFDERGPVTFTITGAQGAEQRLLKGRSVDVNPQLLATGQQDIPDEFNYERLVNPEQNEEGEENTEDDSGADDENTNENEGEDENETPDEPQSESDRQIANLTERDRINRDRMRTLIRAIRRNRSENEDLRRQLRQVQRNGNDRTRRVIGVTRDVQDQNSRLENLLREQRSSSNSRIRSLIRAIRQDREENASLRQQLDDARQLATARQQSNSSRIRTLIREIRRLRGLLPPTGTP